MASSACNCGPKRREGGALLTLAALSGGLLCSSCCVLQLVLNSLSIGCAGFSALTPFQPYFRLMTSGFLAFLFARQGVTRRTLLTLALSLGLMISQDAVSMYNRGELQQALGRLVRGPPSEGVPAPAAPACARYTLAVAGLRCEGCAARLRGTLASLDGVHNATVHFAEARVEVWADSGAVDGRQLVSAVQQLDPSYTADVQQQECYDVHDVPVACRPPPEREL